jgi:threonine synthase
MKRRTILRRASALGLVATAGCLSGATPGTDSNDDRNESGEDQSGDDRTESGDDAPETKAVADATVETVATRCASDEAPTGTVSVDEAATERHLERLHRSGFYAEPTCAVAPAALETLREAGDIGQEEDVVVPLTGSGLKT